MADLLLDALRPLPVTALGPLLAAMREPAGDAVSARAAVLVAAGMPTSATLRDVENVESKLRAAFPSWFVSLPSRTAVATADTALADALHPLPVAKLVPVLDALRAHPDNTATARSFLLQTGVLEDSITFAALGNVNFKLRNAFPQWFSPSADVLGLRRRLAVGSSTCSRCASTLLLHSETRTFLLTYATGKVPAVLETWHCGGCDRLYAGCWSWPRGDVAAARLESTPGSELLLTLSPQATSIAAMDVDLFRFMTASLVHLRSAFRGFAAVLEDFHGMPAAEHLHDALLHAWLVYFSVDFLKDSHWTELSSLAFCLGRAAREKRDVQQQSLGALHGLLQHAFLRQYAQGHSCLTCSTVQTISFDGKVNCAVPVCHVRTGSPFHMLRGDVLLEYGCLCSRARGSFACAAHHTPASVSATALLCPKGHRLRRGRIAVTADAACALCECDLVAKDVAWRCSLRCPWLLCHSCAVSSPITSGPTVILPSADTVPVTEHTLAQRSGRARHSEQDVLAEVHNPCGLVQGLEPGLNRYYGSTLAAVLSCGRVAFIMAIAGGESLTQVYGMLAAVCTRRSLKFVVYDNACALGRFVRGLARRRAGSSSTAAVSSHLLYVLDRWHEQNHTACLDPSHRLYMPEVHMDQYSELNDYDSTLSETFNAWLELFVPCTRHMLPATFDVYIILLSVLWNERVVARRSSCPAASSQPAAAAKPLLKRARCRP